ncbi:MULTISPECIES: A/G-specific adenine glycosylase [unclassified Kaistella]|uniref:A/G-specific adenine glycosylase n=1 Tax=unclassified Kaistella TaxID=2762626 RepID=UPI002735A33B|nr:MULTISPECIES: A/G-specific adenine glycosylase [unclassified Kaistella]MDP2453279.1 A/G-specific adenine glycosylase [Kaistella sp. SH11-4b]MDP2456336.1 A/G-specific adenine glycosylase [Kaistella sp. SH40-3]MDP2459092.1 A/G-specific adenine glycosylase [Kaistella sp. SH19-2b]
MKTKKQNADFLHVGRKLLDWYQIHGRDLPFRKTNDPYKIWICEIIFQQTRIEQGLNHYLNFIQRFPTVQSLASAETDEVLLYWKGLGYYSRALNLHKAALQIVNDFKGIFPTEHQDLLELKGVGKYTAAAISSICFGKKIAAVDGNFYRVLSRVFADDFDVSNSKAFDYFSELALKTMPENEAGHFNEAMMDLGSEICKPRNPLCNSCPLNKDCLAFNLGKIPNFPMKSKKVKPTDLELHYSFVEFEGQFLVRQRKDDFIWKKLYEFPIEIPANWEQYIIKQKTISHKLTHKNLTIQMNYIRLESKEVFTKFADENDFVIMNEEESHEKSFPKPLENYLTECFKTK